MNEVSEAIDRIAALVATGNVGFDCSPRDVVCVCECVPKEKWTPEIKALHKGSAGHCDQPAVTIYAKDAAVLLKAVQPYVKKEFKRVDAV